MGSWIFLVALLFHLSTAETPKPQYILVVPAVVQSGSSNVACLELQNLNETVSVNVTQQYNTEQYLLWSESVTRKNSFQCISFTVPPALPNPLAFIVISVKGSFISFYERRSVAVRNVTTAVFVQTDKPVYKPGQNVMFRVVTLDTNFKPVNEMYPLIYIQDPQGNRIAQWLNQRPSFGILQLELQMVPDTNLGSYQIVVESTSSEEIPSRKIYQWFSIEEYELPRFEVNIKAPERLSAFDEEFKVDICARYTYGQPVQGRVQLRVCRQRYYHPRCNRDSNGICEAISAELGKDGCISKMISTKAFRLYANLDTERFFFLSLQVEGVVTENGTGIQISSSSYISVYQTRKSITFEDVERYYKRGLPLTGKVMLRDEDGLPLANGLVFLEFNGKTVANFTTGKDGSAPFSIDTSDLFEARYKLRAFYQPDQCTDYGWLETYQPESVYYIQRFFSRTDSFVKIEPVLEELPCGQEKPITVHYILNKYQYQDTEPNDIIFSYILMAKGKIVDSGKQQVSIRAGQYSTTSIPLKIDQKLAPRARLLVYSLQPHGEVVADSISFQVEKCFRNKVKLQFSEQQVLPASKVGLYLQASTNSFCALRAVDKSVLLLRPGDNLSPEQVYNQMPYLDLYGYYYGGLDLEDDPKEPCIELQNTFFNGLYYIPVNVSNDGSVYDIFQNMGLKVYTNSTLRKPVVCQGDFECKKLSTDDPDGGVGAGGAIAEKGIAYGASADHLIETVRTYFPETWIWDQVPVNGSATLSYTAPDTITEWQASMFCVESSTGFGMSAPATLKVFQPFFIEVTLPYSAIRGETFLLKANVFNYLDSPIEITVTLHESEDFKAEHLSQNHISRISANESKSYTWTISPQRLGTVNFTVTAEAKAGDQMVGRRDTVTLPLLVEPEGIKKEVTQSALICTKGTPVSESVALNLPENLVKGSARASISVLGDILGTALRNVENLVQMPYGCGEQNIAMFLSNFIVLNYLNSTKQLTEEKRSRIVGHLSGGYQRQLLYKLHDGSFSTFGSRNAEGSLWLTALVYKTFAQSTPFVYIDDNVLNQALIWIASKQEANGCFKPEGKIYNNALQDGADYTILFTAYVTASLLESGLPNSYPVVRNGLSCLDAASNRDMENTYENALLAYMYGLAGEMEKQKSILNALMKSATKTGGLVHWERKKRPPAENVPSFYSRAPSAEIEITGYILLAFLGQENLTQEDLTLASQIAQWIVRQQNPSGGFSSTQDTPVALQALARYGALTFTKDAQSTVEISVGGFFQELFQVDRSNSVLLQQVALPNLPGIYIVGVNGSGCVYTQTTLRYNIILPEQASGFALTVQTRNASCTGDFLPRFEVVLTASYTGERNTSNMAIIDVKMLSGWVPIPSSLKQLRDQVMRVETRNDHVFFYLLDVSSKPVTFALTLEQAHPVTNSKPAEVKIYDYYETDVFAWVEYNTPCQQTSG
ncbi:ovostatin-like isoform X2 [Elgaria multicarinata webbii]|uniref:ovostatin-like isoform X2 n=1 Tax=Elgaria multicarinata webbii TaxID=159646 RepID=UPI002FCD6380